jgi:Spy/CpxP family protein refolding chaperone
MKKVILFLLITFATFSGFSQVQRKVVKDTSSSTHKKIKGEKKKELAELNLSKEQKGKIKEMHKEGKANKEAIKNDPGLTAEQKKEKLDALKADKKNKMQEVLTPEQKQKLKDIKKKKKSQ